MKMPKPFGRLGSRGSARVASNTEALFETPAQVFRVSLLDISRHGARIEMPPPEVRGLEGRLRVGDLAVLCNVVWTRGGLVGLKFYRPLDEEQMRDIQRVVEEGEAGSLARFVASSRAWR